MLDWPVGDVVDYLWDPGHNRRSVDRAATSRQRARALLAEARELCRSGYYLQVVERATRGLREPDAAPLMRSLQAILGAAHYALGSVVEARARVTLCRCGASANKPLCDGSHKEAGFTDA